MRERTFSTVAHQFRKSPAVVNCAQLVDTTKLLCRVTDWARSVSAGFFCRPCDIVELFRPTWSYPWSNTLTAYLNGLICELLIIFSIIEMLHDYAIW